MKLNYQLQNILRALTCAAAVCLAPALGAQVAYRISLNTTPLLGSSAGPFYLDFQLIDGAGFGDGNNKATLSNFRFGGGSSFGATDGLGSFSGNLGTTVILTDTSFVNEFYQAFTPGSTLQFDLNLSTRVDAGPTPDSFAFAILDSTLANLPTLSPIGDVLSWIQITSSSPTVQTYAGSASLAPSAGGPPIALAAATATPIPEPSTYGLLATMGLLGVAAWRSRRRA